MPSAKLLNKPHRRYNPLVGKWILVSPHRGERPWKGKIEKIKEKPANFYEEHCYLCPGNKRISGDINDQYTDCFVFENDFPAMETCSDKEYSEDPLFHAETVNGTCKVICYSPDHGKTLPELDIKAIRNVINTWCDIYLELENAHVWVQIFENKGEINGCSNPHPHGQVWASDHLPQEAEQEDVKQQEYFKTNPSPLLFDYQKAEIDNGDRVVCINDDWVVVVPYWAAWPFETLLLPRTHISHMTDLNMSQKTSLAKLLKELTTRYDNLFETPFPYSMGWHCRPATDDPTEHWLMHAHFYPPLLRSANIQKFMVGYELMAEIQRDITPEKAAQMLRDQPIKHYKSTD